MVYNQEKQRTADGFSIDNLCNDDALESQSVPGTQDFAQAQSLEVGMTYTAGTYTDGDTYTYSTTTVGESVTRNQTLEQSWTLDQVFTQEEVNKVLGTNHHYRPIVDEEVSGNIDDARRDEVRRIKKKNTYDPRRMFWCAPMSAWLPSHNLEILALFLIYNLGVVFFTGLTDVCGDHDTYGYYRFCDVEEDWLFFNGEFLLIFGVGVVFLLAVRFQIAASRYQECCRQWHNLESSCRNLTRLICFHVDTQTDKEAWERRRAISFVKAVPITLKLQLRGLTNAVRYLSDILVHQDILNLMKARDYPQFCVDNINYFLMAQLRHNRLSGTPLVGADNNGMSPIMNAVGALTKMSKVPLPVSFKLHLRFIIVLWLLAVPPYMVVHFGYATALLAFLVDFIILGLESVATEFETPFGYGRNDLDLDRFCDELEADLEQILVRVEHKARDTIFDTWEAARKNEEMIYRATTEELDFLTVSSRKGKQGRAQFVRNATKGLWTIKSSDTPYDENEPTDISNNSIVSAQQPHEPQQQS